MNKYEELLQEATESGVSVYVRDIGRLEGLYVDNAIALSDKIACTDRKACVLAEELGHHALTVGDISDQTKIENVKQEYKARKWAYNKLVPVEDIIMALQNGHGEVYDMAEYLNVDEKFLRECLAHYGLLRM